MTDQEKQKIINNVKASFAMEGLTVSADAENIGKRFLDGEITSEQAISMIKELYATQIEPQNK